MILRSIELEGWRSFVSRTNLGPLSDGLNIIHGPNGSGKSSLMTGLARGLFDSHAAGGAGIRSIRSWGRQLPPRVTIEFEHAGDRFRLQKQFLDSPSAELARYEDGSFVPLRRGRAADEHARNLLAGQPSKSGASDWRHWGLAQILWASQGSLPIETMADQTLTRVQDALGAQVAGGGSGDIETRIGKQYSQFFTGTGRLKRGAAAPAFVSLEKQLSELEGRRDQLRSQLQEFDDASQSIQALRQQATSERDQEAALERELGQLRIKVDSFRKLTADQDILEAEQKTHSTQYQQLIDAIDTINAAEKQRQSAVIESEELAKQLPVAQKQIETLRQQAADANEKVKLLRGQREDVLAGQKLAQLAQRYHDYRQQLIELDQRLQRVQACQDEIDQLQEKRSSLTAPDKETLAEIVAAARQRDDARLLLDAAVITVQIQWQSDQSVQVTRAETSGSQMVADLQQTEIRGVPDVAFEIPGIAKFQATGPTTDFDALRQQWESATSTFQSLTAPYGSDDVASLQRLHATAVELDQALKNAGQAAQASLGNATVDQLSGQRPELAAKLAAIHQEQSGWEATPPDARQLLQAAEDAHQKIANQLTAAEQADDQTQHELQLATRQLERQQEKCERLHAEISDCDSRLVRLRQDGLTDQQRSESRIRVAIDLDVVKTKLADITSQVAALGPNPASSLASLQDQQQLIRNAAAESAKQLHVASGRLQQITTEAPYSQLAEIEEAIEQLQQQVDRSRMQADAIALLYNTVQSQKSNVLQSLIDPIQERANSILQRVLGARFKGLAFDDTLLPTSITPTPNDAEVALGEISGGEQEQVHFAVRMALADLVFPAERQLVVLDDVFTFTDANRLARIIEVLEESARRFQIVLLTCHPERYRAMSQATFFDLETICRQ